MQQFHFQDEESLKAEQATAEAARKLVDRQDEEPLRAERMTEEEAQKIVHLWAENQRESQSGGPTVKDIAEGLEIPTQEARRLLQQVREQEKQVTRPMHQQALNRAPLAAAALIFLLLAMVASGLIFMLRSAPQIAPPPPSAAVMEAPISAPTQPSPAPPAETPAPTKSPTYGGPPDSPR